MIQINNALFEIFTQKELAASRAGVYFFSGTPPTKAQLDEMLEDKERISLNHLYALFNSVLTDHTFLGELITEEVLNTGFIGKEQVSVALSGDAAELKITASGIPTFFVVLSLGTTSELYAEFSRWSGGTSYYSLYTIFGSVGGEGSGADIEIKGGNIVDGNTYKINDLQARIIEP